MKDPIRVVSNWVRRQPPKVKSFLAVLAVMAALMLLRAIVHNHDNLFIAAEAVHSIGISVLIYKLKMERTCAGLSLRSQELTAKFFGYFVKRLIVSASVQLIPCAVFALLIKPATSHYNINRIAWAFFVYLEAVSVLPQLRVMQNTKIVEPFTAHYVFALGVARFLSCAHWVLQVLDSRGGLLVALGYGLWRPMALLSEIVQTFILTVTTTLKGINVGYALMVAPIYMVELSWR
ncbi:ER lumen -retaining receptor [Olea europaea subsp. europaea]|uniref:ER lumen -retaining receptor n=1 Tax=Olea europaea subsp. europaea TaxID=158383 RepID=A0A8S0V0E5_OLEEU|nr:ER lumen -retaining receptor [Olea europaea subsp. europaea]